MRRYLRCAGFLAVCLMILATSADGVSAQGVSAGDLRNLANDIQREQANQAELEDRQRAARQEREQAPALQGPAPNPFAPAPGGPCFQIRQVVVEGWEAFGQKPNGFAHLVGTCATAADIALALNDINQFYQDLGYITTRAYAPEQDLADGSLEIDVVPGRIEGYVYADGSQADARVYMAFPGKRGDLLNLRHIEQGLENINGPKATSARFQLVPGEFPGGSFVQLIVDDNKPWHVELGLDNTGFETTGVVKTSARFGYDNLFGLNDQLSIGGTFTPFDNRGARYSDSYSASWSVPYRNWYFGLDVGKSGYFFNLQGINQSYPVEGRSKYATVSAERLLFRNQTTKFYAYGDLKLSRTRTFIDNNEIESQRRRLTIASLGFRGETSVARGKLSWDVAGKFGLDIFGAKVLEKSVVNPEFRLIKARLNFDHPLPFKGVSYRGTIAGQYSEDILPGTEQFTIGSWSTVRGFHADSMYGDTGVFLRNTIVWDAYRDDIFDVRLNAGVDAGYVEPSDLRNWSQDYLVGASLGADIKIKSRATLTLQVAHALSRPDQNPPNSQPAFEDGRTVGFVGFKVKF